MTRELCSWRRAGGSGVKGLYVCVGGRPGAGRRAAGIGVLMNCGNR